NRTPRAHARLFSDALMELQSSDETRSGELWHELAMAALDGARAGTSPADVAAALNAHAAEDTYDRRIMQALRALALELKDERGAAGDEVRARVAALVGGVSPGVLRRIAVLGGDSLGRRDYLLDFTEGFPPE